MVPWLMMLSSISIQSLSPRRTRRARSRNTPADLSSFVFFVHFVGQLFRLLPHTAAAPGRFGLVITFASLTLVSPDLPAVRHTAAAPPTISASSLVIAACRDLL